MNFHEKCEKSEFYVKIFYHLWGQGIKYRYFYSTELKAPNQAKPYLSLLFLSQCRMFEFDLLPKKNYAPSYIIRHNPQNFNETPETLDSPALCCTNPSVYIYTSS